MSSQSAPSRPYREPPRIAPPPRPPVAGVTLGALGCALLFAFTTRKLDVAEKLRGDAPGIEPRVMTLTGEVRRFNPQQAVYHLSDAQHTPWEIQLTSSQMERYRYGDELAVRCLDDERECFVRDSVFINDGNMGFDRGLQKIELAGLGLCVVAIIRRVVRWRRAVKVLLPPRA